MIGLKSNIKIRLSRKRIAEILLFLIVWIVTIRYCDLDDYYVYYREYNIMARGGIRRQSWEKGFDVICLIFINIGIPFEIFYAIYMSVILTLIWRFMRKILGDSLYFWVLYIIFPYILYLQQIRSALTTAVTMNLLIYLIESNEKKHVRVIKYIVAILLLCTIHSSSLIYFIFLLPLFIKKQTLKKVILAIYIICPLLLIAVFPIIAIFLRRYTIFARFAEMLGAQAYVSTFSISYTILYGILLILLLIADTFPKQKEEDMVAELMYSFSLIVILLSQTVFITDSAYRLSAMLLPIVFSSLILMAKNTRHRLNCFVLLGGGMIFAVTTFMILWGPGNPEMYYRFTHEMWKMHP